MRYPGTIYPLPIQRFYLLHRKGLARKDTLFSGSFQPDVLFLDFVNTINSIYSEATPGMLFTPKHPGCGQEMDYLPI